MIGLPSYPWLTAASVLLCCGGFFRVEGSGGLVKGNGRSCINSIFTVSSHPSDGLNEFGVEVLAAKVDFADAAFPHELL